MPMPRKAVTATCPWCQKAIAMTVPDGPAPKELVDDERSPSLRDLADVFLGLPLPEETGVQTIGLPSGGFATMHKKCIPLIAYSVIAFAPDVIERLRPKKRPKKK